MEWEDSATLDSNRQMPKYLPEYLNLLSNSDGRLRKTKRIYLCRHGETDPNTRRVLQGGGLDESLNETGFNLSHQEKYLNFR